jgi:hypothetical protein
VLATAGVAVTQGGGGASAPASPLAPLCFPDERAAVRLQGSSKQLVDAACKNLLETAASLARGSGALPVLGVSAQGNTSVVGEPYPCAISVAASDGTCFLFHTAFGTTKCMPAALTELLENGAVSKLGSILQLTRSASGRALSPYSTLPMILQALQCKLQAGAQMERHVVC